MKKQFTLFRMVFLLCAMILGGVSPALAEEETIASFTASGANSGNLNGWTITNLEYATANNGYYKLITQNASIVSPSIKWSDYSDITITISARKYGGPDETQGKISVSQGSTELTSYSPSGTSIAASSALTISPNDGTITISCPGASSSKGCGVQSIVIKGTKKASTSPLDFITLSGTYPTSFTEGDEFSHEGMTVTATYEDESTADVTSSASFTGYDMTVLGQNQTVTVSYSEGEVTRTAEYTIIVNALPKHSVTWSVNGTESEPESYKEGAAIEFPVNPADIEGKSFVGWTETAISGTTDETPTFVTSATMGNADITYYAVFADVTPGTSTSITDHLTTSTFGSPTNYTSWTNKTAANGSDAVYAGNSSTYSNTAIQLRSNNSNSGIVTTASGGKAKKVTVSWNNDTQENRTLDIYGKNTAYSAASDLYGTNTQGTKIGSIVFDGESTELTISGDYEFIGLRSNSGAMYINQIDIDWETGTPDTYSGYCTTVAADTREEAGLGFVESTVIVEWYNAAQYTGQALTNPHSVSPITWTSSNEEVATVEDGTVKVLALGETTIKASFDGDENYKKGEASYTLTVQDSRTALELSFDPESVEVNVNETVAIPTLNGNLGNGAVTYASDDANIATVTEDANTSLVVTGLAEGTTTITATVAATNEYKEGTATFTVTVIDPNAPGTVNNPYTVAQAIAATPASGTTDNVYIKGIVSQFYNTSIVDDGSNYRYYISDDGTKTTQLLVYKGKGLNNTAFANADDLKIGDEVVILGKLTTFSNAPEVASGNYIVSLNRGPSITVADATINVDASSQGITRGITIENLTISDMSDFDIQYYDAVGEEVEKPSWIEEATVTVENSAYVLSCTVAANDVEARTAYLKVYAMNGDETIYSNLVTITQAQYVPDYATLPFTFNDGRADIEETNGLTQDGLGTDYNTSPKLKFDGTGDYVILKINEVPGTLTFDIKGNTFSDGTFKVQTSADGINYTDLQTYTELGSTQSEEFDIAANVRYIKWIYTKKVNGNVALGNISLGNTSMAVTIAAACTDGKGKYYGTFSSSSAFEVPENLTVSEIGIDDEGKMNVQNYESGAVVPANTGVMVSATTSGNFKLIKSSEAGTSILDEANALRPTGDGGITAEGMVAEPVVCKYYRLTMHDGTKLGFWWGNENGTSFAVGSNKAYMAVPAGQAAREGFAFDDDSTTGISNVNVNKNVNGSVFDLQGRKVSKPGKGLYIVNGKKVVIK